MFDKDRVCPLLRCALTCLEVCSWKHFLRGLTWRCCWQDGECCDMNWWRNSLRIRSHQATSEHSLTQQEALVLELSDVDADSVKKTFHLGYLKLCLCSRTKATCIAGLSLYIDWHLKYFDMEPIDGHCMEEMLQVAAFDIFWLISGDPGDPGATWANWACLSVRGGVMAIKWADTKWYIYTHYIYIYILPIYIYTYMYIHTCIYIHIYILV